MSAIAPSCSLRATAHTTKRGAGQPARPPPMRKTRMSLLCPCKLWVLLRKIGGGGSHQRRRSSLRHTHLCLHHLQPSTMSTSVPAPAHTPAHTLPFVRSFERGRARMVRGQRRWPRRQSAALAVGARAPPFASLLAHATLSLSFSLCVCARARARSCPAETHRPIAATPLLQSSTKTLSPVTSCSRMRSTLTPSTTSSTRSTAR